MTNKNYAQNIDTDRHPSIHISGSVRGMRERGYWGWRDKIVRAGNYYYNTDILLSPYLGGERQCQQNV